MDKLTQIKKSDADLVVVTEKDAVKLRPLLASRSDIDAWVVPVSASLPAEFYQQVEDRLAASASGAKP